MEAGDGVVCRRSHKRKMCEDESSRFPLNELNQDLLERVLSWLPTSAFFRLNSVCKRWKSVADSATFRLACSQVPIRDPWFFMVDSQPHPSNPPVVFDSTEGNWKKLNHSPLLQLNHESCKDFIPVAASGGLICFHRAADGEFIVNNPVTASCRRLNPSSRSPQTPIRAISMMSKAETFKLVLVSGELPNLTFKVYNSTTDEWGDDIVLTRKADRSTEAETSDDCTQYFLSKCGNVVSTDIQRSPSKQYSSILTLRDGEEILYFLSSSGRVVACNLTRRFFFEYPRLLPVFCEYSIDLVESGGQMYVVLLSEFLETASLRVWTWDDGIQSWRQIAAMPPSMSHKLYGKKADINCTGTGKEMLVCMNSGELSSYVMCNLAANEWVELPECNEKGREFACALSFEPRIEASTWGRM
ncbi:F-box only protein 13 [Sesamum alatum]|uniref:F-box only protein 13 n=1 Tax=Sesamum alatum TaxID=300844 RepID=A0AAE1YTF5_9LAMI|nr:F-box only protein 13 [Sesamum alatum]